VKLDGCYSDPADMDTGLQITALSCALPALKTLLAPQIQKLDITNFCEGVKLYTQELC
jgi:hypothetical protein